MFKKWMILTLFLSLTFCTHTGEVVNESIRQTIQSLDPAKKTMGMHCISSLKVIYKKNRYSSFWSYAKQIDAFLDMIQTAGAEGLDPENYHLSELKKYRLSGMLERGDRIRLDMLLTDSFLLYTTHLLSGKVNPTTIDAQWHVTRKEGDPIQLFLASLKKKDMAAPLKSVLIKNRPYQKLKHSLLRYGEIQKKGGWEGISKGPLIYPQHKDSRIPLIRKRLALSGDYSGRLNHASTVYDQDLQRAVKHFQKRHGLVNKGIIGEATVREMNIPVKKRMEQIRVNMERYRWLPKAFRHYYILVNIADFMLEVVKDQQRIHSQKIIVGKPFKKTPVFSSQIYYLIFNPTWTIPRSIIRSDILPAMEKRSDYLVKQRITIFDNRRNPVQPERVDWRRANLNNYLFRQEAGPVNSLGVVKFMLPNAFDIYLHDTPSKGLFNKANRAFSAGCIRLHQPIALAELLLEGQPNWDINGIRQAITNGITQKVTLTTRPDIHLIYLTAWVDEDNTLQFRSDIYERDRPLYNALIKK